MYKGSKNRNTNIFGNLRYSKNSFKFLRDPYMIQPTSRKFSKIVAAFRGMHVSPAKHSSASVTDGQTDRQTDRRTDRQTDDGQSDPYVSLCFAGDTKSLFCSTSEDLKAVSNVLQIFETQRNKHIHIIFVTVDNFCTSEFINLFYKHT